MLPPLSADFIKEYIENDRKNFRLYETYTPNYKQTMLTYKFYSKYECPKWDAVDPVVIEKVRKANDDPPRKKYPWPMTENQIYGWFYEPLTDVDRGDRRFYHPKVSNDFIKHYLRLQEEESGMPKSKFIIQIPFKLQ